MLPYFNRYRQYSLSFILISGAKSDYKESKIRDIIFEVTVETKIYKRFDTSHPFWKNFNARKPKRQKKLGLYEVECIDNPCYVTLAVNTKDYFEFFRDCSTNKKYKGIKKDHEEWNIPVMQTVLNL